MRYLGLDSAAGDLCHRAAFRPSRTRRRWIPACSADHVLSQVPLMGRDARGLPWAWPFGLLMAATSTPRRREITACAASSPASRGCPDHPQAVRPGVIPEPSAAGASPCKSGAGRGFRSLVADHRPSAVRPGLVGGALRLPPDAAGDPGARFLLQGPEFPAQRAARPGHRRLRRGRQARSGNHRTAFRPGQPVPPPGEIERAIRAPEPAFARRPALPGS